LGPDPLTVSRSALKILGIHFQVDDSESSRVAVTAATLSQKVYATG